jgi:hypothetical protein
MDCVGMPIPFLGCAYLVMRVVVFFVSMGMAVTT